jgi:hypothetical protein
LRASTAHLDFDLTYYYYYRSGLPAVVFQAAAGKYNVAPFVEVGEAMVDRTKDKGRGPRLLLA